MDEPDEHNKESSTPGFTRTPEPEEEIGRLILRVRNLTEAAEKQAGDEAMRIVEQAQAEAMRIVESARLRAWGRRASVLPAAAIHQIQAAVDQIQQVNSDLGHEVRRLHDALDAEFRARPPGSP
jgi:uncharacterized protein